MEYVNTDMLNTVSLTFKLALVTSVLLLLIVMPLAWFLANWRHSAKSFVLSIFALPLVLPPTVLGFYLLIAFSPESALGTWWLDLFGSTLAFSFEGLVLGSLIYSLPFALQPLYSGFTQLNKGYLEVATSLGFSPLETFFRIVLPQCKAAVIVAFGLSFAHTVGEFGVVLMIGGNIPTETQVLSIALYEQVEALEYERAHVMSLGLLVFSFVALALLYRFDGNKRHAAVSQHRVDS